MVIKRKAVASALVQGKRTRSGKVEAEVEEKELEEEIEEMKDEVEEEEVKTPEETEKEIVAARTKELKAMYIDELKQLATKMGLEAGKKDAIIKAVIAHEAQKRASVREQEEKVRGVVTKKKEELEAMSVVELKQMCAAINILTGQVSKQARVEELLKQWLSDDGVDKALAKLAQDAREMELKAMDAVKLQKLCIKVGVNPFVKELMIDRIVRCEGDQGRFSAPVLQNTREQDEVPSKKGSLVESLLASESQRKKDFELKQQQEEAAAKKLQEFQAMSIGNLKQALAKKGQKDTTGKKEELVKTLLGICEEEGKVAARRSILQSLAPEDLKKLVLKQGLPIVTKPKMIESLLAQECKLRDAIAAHECKIQKALAKKKEELEQKTGNELKELCSGKGLPVGTGKEFRIERLLEDAKASGEADNLAATMTRNARTPELHSFDIDSLHKLCNEVGADPLMKDVMVERMIAHESTFGSAKVDK